MNESESKTSGTARGTSSLEALSKTIDGLEARLENLVSRKATASAERGSSPEDRGSGTPRDSMAAEIFERQRTLDRERAGLEARLAAHRPASASGATDKALRDIAESLVGLRADLKKDLSDSLGGELAAIREEIAVMSAGHAQPLPRAMREEMLRLADCIERLGARTSASEDERLAGEVHALRAVLEEVAAESRRGLLSVESRLGEADPQALRNEVIGLAHRLDEMKESVSALAGTSDGSGIEAQLKNVVSTMETLAEQVNLDEASIDHRFSELAHRLDEISRAIVSVGSRSDRSQDAETLARIESRLAGLSGRIDEIGEGSESVDRLAGRMTALAGRLDTLASEDAVAGLAERLDQLSLMLEQDAAGDGSDLTRRLTEISAKIDALDHGALDDTLTSRLDDLAGRIDRIAAGLDAASEKMFDKIEELTARAGEPGEVVVPAGLEERLVEIVERLDDLRTAAPDADAAPNLEARLAHLTELLNRSVTGDGEAGLAPRLSAIEEHLETTDEYIIEAARQAAEAVVESYGRNSGGQDPSRTGEIAVISELAEDLRALERLSEKSEERTARAFDAVHDTLVRIAEHLEAIGPLRGESLSDDEPSDLDGEGDRNREERHEEAPDLVEAVTDTDRTAVGEEHEAGAWIEEAADQVETTLKEDDGFLGVGTEAGGEPPQKKGLLAKVGERMRPARRAPRSDDEMVPEEPARKSVALAPSIDPSDALDRPEVEEKDNERKQEDAASLNEPLEPGSGAPDIDRILRKVREVQNQEVQRDDKSDFIAAARRAAQAAAAEVETVSGVRNRKRSRGLAAMIKARRRPILLAVGAILLVVMSWPLASALLKRPGTPVAVNAPAGRAAKSGTDVAAAAKPKVSKEKTGATAVEGPSLPKVRAIAEGNEAAAGQADKANVSATGSPQAATVPSAVDAAAVPSATASAATRAPQAGPGVAEASPAAGETARSAAQAKSAAPAPQASAASAPTPPAGNADAGKATEAAATNTAVADAVPQVPAAIGSQSLRTAASKGDPKALYEIGVFYTEGHGVETDLGAAAKWYRAAAERGLAPAQYRLANLYEKGTGVDRNVDKARTWYLKAADQGNVSAMHNLAVLYAMGKDGKPDYASAAEWFRKAAEHGVRDSQFNLAILYAQGHGVPRDLTQSYKWFAVAASKGDSDATQKRDEVAAALSPADLKKARAAASEWKPVPVIPSANQVAVPPEWNGADTRTASVDMSKAIRNIQAILDNNGFDAGKPDGIMGQKTRSAIRAFQKSIGEKPTGKVTDALIRKLLELNRRQKGGEAS